MRVKVHLVTGEVVESAPTGDLDPEKVEDFEAVMGEMMTAGPERGWHVEIELPGGGKAWFPRSSVLYVEAL